MAGEQGSMISAYRKQLITVLSLVLILLLIGSVLLFVRQREKQHQIIIIREKQNAEISRVDTLVGEYNNTMRQAQGDLRSIKVQEAKIASDEQKLEAASIPSPYPLINQSNRDLSSSYEDSLNDEREAKERYSDRLRGDVQKAQQIRSRVDASSVFTDHYQDADFCLEATDADALPEGAEQFRFLKRK